jgi:hypothetical protein
MELLRIINIIKTRKHFSFCSGKEAHEFFSSPRICYEQFVRASPAVEGPQAEIRLYLALNGCKFWHGETHISSGEPRTHFEFKLKVDEKRRTLTKFDET